MLLAAAQTRPHKGDIPANLAAHARLIAQAAAHRAGLIVFPELSLTGYEPTLAKELATHANDPRFGELQTLSDTHRITVCAGMPTPAGDDIHISMLIFQPHQPRQTYSKLLLYKTELPYFVSGHEQVLLTFGDHVIAPAICYESKQPERVEQAVRAGATVYLTSAARSAGDVETALAFYKELAKEQAMIVVASNCVGSGHNFTGGGKSSVWNTKGELAGQLDDRSEGILVYDTETQEVITEVCNAVNR